MTTKALIVEDEVLANELLARLVQLRGCQTESAFTGREALQIASERQPDLIFLDLMLPDTNGFEVCRTLKSRRETALIPIVVVTARVAPENRDQCFRVGATEFIGKPYTPDEIFGALNTAQRWRQSIEQHAPAGRIVVSTANDPGVFEEIARLQSLLLARTPLEEADVSWLIHHLGALAQELLTWGRRHCRTDVAALGFSLQPERFDLTIADQAGWFPAGESAVNPDLAALRSSGWFDSVTTSQSPDALSFTKRFPGPNAPRMA